MSDGATPEAAEDFRTFFKRRTGITYPWLALDSPPRAWARVADVMAEWCDDVARRAKGSPPA